MVAEWAPWPEGPAVDVDRAVAGQGRTPTRESWVSASGWRLPVVYPTSRERWEMLVLCFAMGFSGKRDQVENLPLTVTAT